MAFWQLTFDAHDPAALALFWATALDYRPVPPAEPDTPWNRHYRRRLGDAEEFEDRIFDPLGQRPPIWFQAVPEEKSGKNRLHVDLYPTGRDDTATPEQRIVAVESKVAELVALGAHVLGRTREDDPDDPIYYVVMRDPEGNEFCVS
jgi:hypothetical protein